MNIDKNKTTLNIGDYICICDMLTAHKIESRTSIGVYIEQNNPLSQEVLKINHRKISNTFGFIPLVFFEQEKIKLCPPEEYPECHI